MGYRLFPKPNIAKYHGRYHTGCTDQLFSALSFVLMVFVARLLEHECTDSIRLKSMKTAMGLVPANRATIQ